MKRFIPSYYTICAITTFLSAFLLFQVQPLISKHILPWYGGGSMVWMSALFFFIFVLLGGYIYVLILSFFSIKIQKGVHFFLICLVLLLVLFHQYSEESGITLSYPEKLLELEPIVSILLILFISVGAPFFLLSTTSSLVQLWYGNSTGKEPFSLYSISNIGSLIGLLSYPFFIEARFSTPTQGTLWTGGFLLYLLFFFGVFFHTKNATPSGKYGNSLILELRSHFKFSRFISWIVVASVPVIIMLTSTNYVTGFVASMPFIWVMPLFFYLLSFIISFRPGERKIGTLTILFVFLSIIISLWIIITSNERNLILILGFVWWSGFMISHYCHEWLYENRPTQNALPIFYVSLSLGGALGSLLVLCSMLVFSPAPLEYIYILVLILIVVLFHLYTYSYRQSEISKIHFLLFVLVTSITLFSLFYQRQDKVVIIASERNFYGYKTVYEYRNGDNQLLRGLTHEKTVHGIEYQEDRKKQIKSAYYTESSGLGLTMQYIRNNSKNTLDVAVAGLGAGIINSYCNQGDSFIFFEIDKGVYSLAKKYFTFLDFCDSVVEIGDARKLISKKQSESKQFDVIIIDAYSDDALPTHLLTTEATKLYLSVLRDDGFIIFHVSSKYLNLLPVISGLAQDNNLIGKYYTDRNPTNRGVTSEWAILTKNKKIESTPEFSNMVDLRALNPIFWTDTKNALWQVVKFGKETQ